MSDTLDPKRDWILVARILRPRGNKGEVIAELLTDFPERFSRQKQIYLRKGQEAQAICLQRFWMDRNHPGMGVFHFAGCATISDAEKLRGLAVVVPFEQRATLGAGQYFVTDLIGCSVFETPVSEAKLASPACGMEQVPRLVGTVKDVFLPGEGVAGTPLLQVETPQGELLVPLAVDICTRIDVAARRIDVRLPEGLSELRVRES